MEDRIKINGVWYVKEATIQDSVNYFRSQEIKLQTTSFIGRVYESDLYCFEVTKILNDNKTPLDGVNIEISNKRVKPWKVEHIDSSKWCIEVLENDPESMEEALEMFCEFGIEEFRSVIKDLIKEDWIKKP
jgi:hypothetical protein